jgi:DNA processing protein
MTAVDNLRLVGPKPGEMTLSALARVPRGTPDYPARLLRLPCPPAELWLRGQLPDPPRLGVGAIAIVGSRAASGDGCDLARRLGGELARAGVAVVSGGAFGIDAAGHRGALAAGGRTYAVLGCGADVVYPDRHAGLFDEIAARGGLLSEYPPGTQPRRGQFPSRNRIIAALVDAVVVVEAAARSGALGTARLARSLGIPVLVFPGSPGTGHLTRGGAIRVDHPAEVLDVVRGALEGLKPAARAPEVLWPQDEAAGPLRRLLDAMGDRPHGAESLARRLNWSLPEVMGALGEAEIEGWIRRVPGGAYEVSRGH